MKIKKKVIFITKYIYSEHHKQFFVAQNIKAIIYAWLFFPLNFNSEIFSGGTLI